MRIVKKNYSGDQRSLLLSRAFNRAIKSIDVPINFEYLEFKIGYDCSEVEDEKAVFGLLPEDPMLNDMDKRSARILITFELYRLFVRNIITRKIPLLIEDVIVAREMISRGHSEDLVYIFYAYMIRHRIKDYATFLKFNLPWIIFYNRDSFYYDLFLQLAKSKRRYNYESKAKELIEALCKDLMDFENLRNAISVYEKTMHEN